MDRAQKVLNNIEIATNNLKIESIQELLVLVKEESKCKFGKEFWNKAADILWKHLRECLEKLDDHLLCSTCFYSVLALTDKQDHYLNELLYIVGPDPNSPSQVIRESMPGSKRLPWKTHDDLEVCGDNSEKDQSIYTFRVVSLMYGMFQSSFLLQKENYNIPITAAVINEMFDLLILMGYEYSQYTFLAFKTLKSFKKICGGPLENYIFKKENQEKLLTLVNNNWENPITGVRDMNRSIFQLVVSTLDCATYEKVLNEIDGFYWNKAKFLMLSEIIESYKGNIKSLVTNKWIDGLIYSLHKPGLVSAGADMYYALLKKIDSPDFWCQLFLTNIIKILTSNNSKAIENFSNYWCITTMKKFATTTQVLINELEKENLEQVLYSKLCILKQANKLGTVEKNWNSAADNMTIQKTVQAGIQHCNSYIRILAFDIVCVSQGKSIPSPIEYELIMNYLHNNVNSDSTVLRLSMFSSFNYFLTQLHFTFINVIIKNDNNEALQNLIDFCKRLQNFIIYNFKLNGNYQRKITTVKLCNLILTCFSEIPRKRKDQTRQANVTLISYLKQNSHWILSTDEFIKTLISFLKDSADDIRENVVKILLNHYTNDLQDSLLTHIINDAKQSMSSKFFYEISCGQSMFKLITNLLINRKILVQTEYQSVEEVFEFAYSELITQHSAETNVMKSIETGKQLHSFMSILIVVLEECISKSYNIDIHSRIGELLEVLDGISNQFAWEEEGSSDFSKMNDMVQNIIVSSGYNPADVDDHTKISGLQQIVLNCLWLNVKASCDLASVLIQYCGDDVSMCVKCLNIITHVLETSRHKGAIEAAGAALGRGIQYLTSLPEKDTNIAEGVKNDVSKVPFTLLKCKLQDLILETNKMSSITRRGAGLSIMVHRIVSSDMKKSKPLFHFFLKTLLNICNNKGHSELNSCQPNVTDDDNMENQVDLPKAIYIHFMTRIVTDSSLATDMMYYSVELVELAFGNLTSSHWQIRNAALQLYGALIPRLIGQKKASGTDEETIATVACDEMCTHLPKLWAYILEQLKLNSGKDLIQTHSNLVPILNMLANSAKRYYITLHSMKQDDEFYKLFNHLITLLNSPIYTVRRLTARTIFNIYEFDFICDGILKQDDITENQLHGFLILLNLCFKFSMENSISENILKDLKDKFCIIFNTKKHSYLCKKLFEDIYVKEIEMSHVNNTILETNGNLSPGVQLWAEARLKKYINKCSWSDIPILLKILLQESDYEKYCELVLLKTKTQTCVPTEVLIEMADLLKSFEKRYCSSIIWKIIYEISLKTTLSIDSEELLKALDGSLSYNLRYMIPLIARNIGSSTNENKSNIMKTINNLCDFENSDVDMRYIAGVANNEIAHEMKMLPDSLKVISIKCAVLLLQDEDEDVRHLTVKYYSILCKEKGLYQPYICLNKILNRNFLYAVFDDAESSIKDLKKQISDILNLNHNIDEYNPFANDSKNIYFEPDVLKQALINLK